MNNDSDFLFTQFPGKEGSDIHKHNDQEEIKNILQQGISKEGEEPLWYRKDHLYNWFINNGYSKEIALELSEEWAKDLQGAFKKGWEMGRNKDKDPDESYQYLSSPSSSKGEDKVFTLIEALDIWKACEDYSHDYYNPGGWEVLNAPEKEDYFKQKFDIDIDI